MTRNSPLLTVSEVAQELRVHTATVGRWAREGRVPAIKLPGGTFRFRREDVDALITPATQA
jgi:excisionase family DNA binding protein